MTVHWNWTKAAKQQKVKVSGVDQTNQGTLSGPKLKTQLLPLDAEGRRRVAEILAQYPMERDI